MTFIMAYCLKGFIDESLMRLKLFLVNELVISNPFFPTLV